MKKKSNFINGAWWHLETHIDLQHSASERLQQTILTKRKVIQTKDNQ